MHTCLFVAFYVHGVYVDICADVYVVFLWVGDCLCGNFGTWLCMW